MDNELEQLRKQLQQKQTQIVELEETIAKLKADNEYLEDKYTNVLDLVNRYERNEI